MKQAKDKGRFATVSDGYSTYIRYKGDKEEYTLDEVKELYKEELEEGLRMIKEKEERAKQRQKERQEKEQEAIRKAKETGKPVIIEYAGFIDMDNLSWIDRMLYGDVIKKYDEEAGIIQIVRVAKPDGTIDVEYIPTY